VLAAVVHATCVQLRSSSGSGSGVSGSIVTQVTHHLYLYLACVNASQLGNCNGTPSRPCSAPGLLEAAAAAAAGSPDLVSRRESHGLCSLRPDHPVMHAHARARPAAAAAAGGGLRGARCAHLPEESTCPGVSILNCVIRTGVASVNLSQNGPASKME
jgi:hypothetical protein